MDAQDLVETLGVAALVAAASLPLLRLRHGLRMLLVASGIALGATALWTAARPPVVAEARVTGRPVRVADDGYVSSSTCRSCHPRPYATWHASYHRTMTQVATPETVLAPFDGEPRVVDGRHYRPFVRDGELWIEMDDPYARGPDPLPRIERRVVLSTGSHHEQDYWFETGRGRALAHLPIVYRIEEQRWLPNGSTFLKPPGRPGAAPAPEVGGWNRNCIQCHSTDGRPLFDAQGAVDTTVGELGIACEACHGPGAEHVAANRDPIRRLALRRDPSAHDDTIVNPARLGPRRASEVCGQCHMVSTVFGPATHPQWNAEGPAFRPGDELAATRDVVRPAVEPESDGVARLTRASPDSLRFRFWPDGMVRITGRELQGLLETPCHQRGELTCTTCHAMHPEAGEGRDLAGWADDQLDPAARGDDACLECHGAMAADVPAHTHHAPGSSGSACMNCHMPHTTYGLLKAVRTHQVTSPDARTTLATTRPNACNLCHLDRPLAWTAEHLERWYGTPRPELPARESEVASSLLWVLTGDAGHRALVAWHMGWAPAIEASGGAGWMQLPLAHLLDDPYDAVRFVAARSLRRSSLAGELDYDFLDPPEARRATRAALLGVLFERPLEAGADARALLRDGQGRFDRERFARLAGQRDDRPLELRE